MDTSGNGSAGRTGEFYLTPREHQVLDLFLGGMEDRAISSRLGLCPYTVKFHIKNLRMKFNARNRTQLAIAALTHRMETPR